MTANAGPWDTVQSDLRSGKYGDWQTIRHCLAVVEAGRNPDEGIGTSDINHMAYAWVNQGADLAGLLWDARWAA